MRLQGRAGEREELVLRLELAARGRVQVAFVEGEAGIGKTRLVAETIEVAERRGFRVFRGWAEELERARPFGVLADALGCDRRSPDPERAALGRLVTGEVAGVGAVSQFGVVASFVELVEGVVAGGPVLLALEDLHWADPATLLAVRAIVRQLADAPVLVVGSYRPVPARLDLQRLVQVSRDECAAVLRLTPLTGQAVAALAAEAAGADPGPRLRRQLTRAGGNPLFVLELVRSLDHEGALRRTGGRVEAAEVELPATVRLTILRRLDDLPAATRELLEMASILGSTLSLSDLSLITRRPVLELLPALRVARAAGVLGEAGGQLVFRHDLVREAIYTDLLEPVRQGLHHEVGRALAAAGAEPVRVATHLARGAGVGGADAAEAVEWLRRAASDTGSRAPAVAAELLARAVELLDPSHPARDRLLVEQVEALGWAGRQRDSETLARAVLDRPHDPAVEGELRLHLSRSLVIHVRARDALAVIAATDQTALTDAERVQLRAVGAWAQTSCGELDGALAAGEAARTEALSLGDDAAWCVAAAVVAIVGIYRGDIAAAVRLAEEVVGRTEESPAPDTRRMTCYHTLAIGLIEADLLDEAEAAINRFRGGAEAAGGTWSLPRLFYASTTRRFVAGEWDDAIAESETLLGMDVTPGSILVPLVHSKLAMIAIHRGRLEAADAHVREAEITLLEHGQHPRTSWVAWARGLLHEARGRPEEALRALEQAWAENTDLGVVAEYPRLGPDLVRLVVAAGLRDRAVAVTEATETVASRMGTAGATAAALRCRGLLSGDPEVLLRAVAAARAAPRPMDRAAACAEAAVALGRAGRLAEARTLFDEALHVWEGLGARYDLDRVAAEMRALGIRRGKRGARHRAATGWESLTETEQRVVTFAADGLTNSQIAGRLFISHHTVATHLAHVFSKLGVRSRVELAAEAARRTGS